MRSAGWESGYRFASRIRSSLSYTDIAVYPLAMSARNRLRRLEAHLVEHWARLREIRWVAGELTAIALALDVREVSENGFETLQNPSKIRHCTRSQSSLTIDASSCSANDQMGVGAGPVDPVVAGSSPVALAR